MKSRFHIKYKYRKYITLSVLALILTLVVISVRSCLRDKPKEEAGVSNEIVSHPRTYDVVQSSEPVRNYAKEFCDSQQVQIVAAKAMGLAPMSEQQIQSALGRQRLCRLHDCKYYYLYDVDYPYLVPEAFDLLSQIGKMFQVNMQNPYARLRVSSCLRTEASVKRLQRRNRNSVTESCHLYGTTFDISYAFMEPNEKQALARALRDLHDAGYCYVKYERKQPCFHITVRK